ncbi:MAG: pantetheine-phosphate adenylyltransferase [Clostridia bacterium]|nr:pantetheine-phosphate adenylyltransferase [Clostridia bacterium]
MKKCVFAGTFDPPTAGHQAVVQTCLKLFDEVVVAVMINTAKKPFFTAEERVALLTKLFDDAKGVKVISFCGAAVDLLKQEGTVFYVRGVRNTIDFEYENADYFASKKLMPELEEIYIPAVQENIQISSTLVKNSVKFKKDYDFYIPQKIAEDMKKLLEAKNV